MLARLLRHTSPSKWPFSDCTCQKTLVLTFKAGKLKIFENSQKMNGIHLSMTLN